MCALLQLGLHVLLRTERGLGATKANLPLHAISMFSAYPTELIQKFHIK